MNMKKNEKKRAPTRRNRFPYKVIFDRVFEPVALYRVKEKGMGPTNAERVFFIDTNLAYERVMKKNRSEIIGRSFLEVWPLSEDCWSQLIVDCLRLGHVVHCEAESRDAGAYFEAIAFPIPPNMVSVVFLDKTEWKRSEDALKRKQEELRILAAQLTLSEENTRRGIATDIHDRVGYALVAQLRRLREMREEYASPELGADLDRLIANTETLITESRNLIFELSPPILKEVGLNPALEALAENLLKPQGIRWELRCRGSMEEFDAEDAVCVLLYRMTRELLINVIKHAEATRVNIIVNRGYEKILVAVEDDGKGFPQNFCPDDPTREAVCRSFGLFSIRERLQSLGGDVRVLSVPGGGATVAMSCPLRLKKGDLK